MVIGSMSVLVNGSLTMPFPIFSFAVSDGTMVPAFVAHVLNTRMVNVEASGKDVLIAVEFLSNIAVIKSIEDIDQISCLEL